MFKNDWLIVVFNQNLTLKFYLESKKSYEFGQDKSENFDYAPWNLTFLAIYAILIYYIY